MVEYGPVGFCPECNSYIQSLHRHNYHTCQCGASSIDGGGCYTRIVGKTVVLGDIYDAHIHKLNKDFSEIDLEWGNYGPLFCDIAVKREGGMCCPTLIRQNYWKTCHNPYAYPENYDDL